MWTIDSPTRVLYTVKSSIMSQMGLQSGGCRVMKLSKNGLPARDLRTGALELVFLESPSLSSFAATGNGLVTSRLFLTWYRE